MKNSRKSAQSLIEYGLILALVAVVAVTILGKFSKSINKIGNQADTAVSSSSTNALCTYCKNTATTTDASGNETTDATVYAKCLNDSNLTAADCN